MIVHTNLDFPSSIFRSFPGDKDISEEEELGDVQLQTVVLPVWDAGAPV